MGHAYSGRCGAADHDRVAGAVVLVQDHQVFDRLAHLGDVADEHDQPAAVVGHQPADPFHRAVEMLGVERAEPLVQEEGVEPSAARATISASASARLSEARKVSPPESESAFLGRSAALRSRMSKLSSAENR